MKLALQTGLRMRLCMAAVTLAAVCAPGLQSRAAERVTLRTGFSYDCVRTVALDKGMVRLFLEPETGSFDRDGNFIDVAASRLASVETIPDPVAVAIVPPRLAPASTVGLTAVEMHELLARAGERHHIDEDLLASVVKAESGGHVKAVSRTGARGLMQLMPGTASTLGVGDAFVPAENIAGGTAYLDQMLTRYHDNLAWALAAYNAGPAAVDRYHGIPPYRETQAYVARVIREFNRRKRATAAALSAHAAAPLIPGGR